MLHELSGKIADFLLKKNCFKKEELDVYIYGVELIISSVIGMLLILVISVLISAFIEGLIFICTFVVLRSFTGGYHCYTYLKCNTLFVASFLLCILIYKLAVPFDWAVYLLSFASIVFSGVVIIRFSPVEHENKPLDDRQKKICRVKAIAIYSFIVTAMIILYCCYINLAFIFPLVLSLVAAAMLGQIYIRRGKTYYEKGKSS